MFDELSTASAAYQAPKPTTPPQSNEARNLEELVAQVLLVEERLPPLDNRVAAGFIGRLMLDSAAAFDLLDTQLKPLDYMAQFSTIQEAGQYQGKHQIIIFRDRPHPQPRPWWPNALLLGLTIFSMMWAGAGIGSDEDTSRIGHLITSGKILNGWLYALSLMLILGAHELGHYFAARYHKVSVTLPYFIPLPIGIFGTLGAFIQQREPPLNRRQLFDIGVSGPLAGLVFALPILLIGIATAEINNLPTEADCARDETQCGYILEGNSLLYAAAKYVVHGEWLPTKTYDMTLNQMAFAGWTGLFVTALNLIPVGQLDGGHVLYTLVGGQARRVYVPALIILGLLALWNGNWIIWVLLLFFFGRVHNVPLDDITPLDNRRRLIGFLALGFFVLIFTPSPLTVITLN